MENVTSTDVKDINHRKSHLPLILGTIAVLAAGDIYFFSHTRTLEGRLSQLQSSMQSNLASMQESWQTPSGTTQKTLEALQAQLSDERNQAMRAANQASRSA